ncbi:hypothetical protein MMC24_006883 [Lignoscripta atroalba]|nr:hypothetical protein [Lignoscripta atroalba]
MGSLGALERRHSLTGRLYQNPYDATLYLARAGCYEELGFPDLAAGDAYKALLLTDEAQDDSGEYHEQALEAIEAALKDRVPHANGQSTTIGYNNAPSGDVKVKFAGGAQEYEDGRIRETLRSYALDSYIVLARCLLACGCLRSAYDFCDRGLLTTPDNQFLITYKAQILQRNKPAQSQRSSPRDDLTFEAKNDLPDQGSVRRELYPWNVYEPDRFSVSSLSFLNAEMSRVAPKCTVLAVTLPLLSEDSSTNTAKPEIKQLGVFAKEDIGPGETVLHESSVLTANNRLHDPLCDACSSELPPISSQDLYACPDCDDTIFCSELCLNTAMSTYHPAVCGKDLDAVGKDTDPREAADSLYLLLLERAVALAETQGLHPLELNETKYLWGDFIHPDSAYIHSSTSSAFTTARHLPFSFSHNILSPLHILEKMDVDIFKDLERYDVWIFNTLYAKFRGTASARLSTRDGRPEVCAVHPMWCLANHSCAPNVRWEWAGEIKFWARTAAEVVQWGDGGGRRDKRSGSGGGGGGGIMKGQEVLNHYCDVDLPVRGRREWAVGALGGICVCERCVWEAGNSEGE